MKVISIWQPYAGLLIHRFKMNETRSWPAPASLIGQRIGIAATKAIKAEQVLCYQNPTFQRHYRETGMPPLEELPRGAILGTALLHSCDYIDPETIEDVTDAEKAFGVYTPGRFAWRMRDPRPFAHPVVARGQQGIWSWNEHDVLSLDETSHGHAL